MRCVLVGDEPLVAQCADAARANGLEVVLVATTNAVVRDYATEHGIAVSGPGAELVTALDTHPADVLFSIANLRVLPAAVLGKVSTAINFHDGPLPGYAGLNVTTWALLGGEDHHAITWHVMTSDVDAGEVVVSETFPVAPDETAFSLNARCYEAALATFPRIAAAIAEGTLATTPQPAGESRMFRRHDRPAVLLDPLAAAADSSRADPRPRPRPPPAQQHRRRPPRARRRRRRRRGRRRARCHRRRCRRARSCPSTTRACGSPRRTATCGSAPCTRRRVAGSIPPSSATGSVYAPVPACRPRRPTPSPPLAELEPAMSRDELFWLDRLTAGEPTAPPTTLAGSWSTVTVDTGGATTRRSSPPSPCGSPTSPTRRRPTFAVTDHATRTVLDRIAPLGRPATLRVTLDDTTTFDDARRAVAAELDVIAARTPLLRDAVGRDPRTRGHELTAPVLVQLGAAAPAASGPIAGERLRITVDDGTIRLDAPADATTLGRVGEQLATLVRGGDQPATPIGRLAIVGPDELADLDAVNRTARDHDRAATIDSLFHATVARHPDAPALSSGPTTLTYARLESAVDAMARRLADLGVGRGDRVGIAVPRGVEMVVGVLATLDLGAAYVPLDPTYPADRLEFMVDDAGISVLLATGAAAGELARPGLTVLDPADVPESTDAGRTTVEHDASDLAYVIYTSGSTGTPKGVMLEHGNVTNFFVAMDDVDRPRPARRVAGGHQPVLRHLRARAAVDPDARVPRRAQVRQRCAVGGGTAATVPAGDRRPVSFSLFYFAAGADVATDGYRLLLESAKWADRNGFEAVWTPERHFHAFGASYPNPSVAGAALAAITTNVGIRAGSVVLPLHSPIRVAEEWAVVDNLSHGRVAISFAAGWQPNDFVLNPTGFANAKEELPKNIELVQRLWRGETVAMPGHDGKPVDVRTLPRPVQAELPIWLTSAGSPATFERAGTLGVNVLTHLLGQSVEQLAENIGRYRAAWQAAGHEGEGRVTLMMHTFLDRDADIARETAREPMKGYLGTAVGLLRDVASAFPTFAGRGKGTDDLFASLTADELDQLLEVAAARYLGTSGLFGTPADAAAIVETVSAAGVDEVACLIDFGVATDDVLGSLELLHEAKSLVDAHRLAGPSEVVAPVEEVDDSVAALVARHGVTHLQCTPSLAAMLVADPADQAALGKVGHLMLGGEALPAALASELRGLLPGRFTNMYGPTETTIWSLTHEITDAPSGGVPIGGPIANTTIFVLDHAGGRLPFGAFGELHIGGEGVARGYHDRPELTAERFVDRPGMGRVYATGDVVRINPAGYVEFAGRSDNQVKIRGHRIELGEIESVLDHHPDVVQSVVVARDDRGDTRLVAYVILHGGAVATTDALRKHVAATLPEAMVPSAVVTLRRVPADPERQDRPQGAARRRRRHG